MHACCMHVACMLRVCVACVLHLFGSVDGVSRGWAAIPSSEISVGIQDFGNGSSAPKTLYMRACRVDFPSRNRMLRVRLRSSSGREWMIEQPVLAFNATLSLTVDGTAADKHYLVTASAVAVEITVEDFALGGAQPKLCLQLGTRWRDCGLQSPSALPGVDGSFQLYHRIDNLAPGRHTLKALLLAPTASTDEHVVFAVSHVVHVHFAPGLPKKLTAHTVPCTLGRTELWLMPSALPPHRAICLYGEFLSAALAPIVHERAAMPPCGTLVLGDAGLEWVGPSLDRMRDRTVWLLTGKSAESQADVVDVRGMEKAELREVVEMALVTFVRLPLATIVIATHSAGCADELAAVEPAMAQHPFTVLIVDPAPPCAAATTQYMASLAYRHIRTHAYALVHVQARPQTHACAHALTAAHRSTMRRGARQMQEVLRWRCTAVMR